MTVLPVFRTCVEAITHNELIARESNKDKEFHFQNWFEKRLAGSGLHYEVAGRNKYPDFSIVAHADGYELKGLAYPGRDATFDSNSQVPTGFHNGRTVYYVFGRYPKHPDGNAYPVMDLVVCHGDFLNADHEYTHKNRSVRGFGSYGDLLIRDRKMYVVPTPFRRVDGAAHHRTLILPADVEAGSGFSQVGELVRREADNLIVRYSFDLKTNEIEAGKVPNPYAGREHFFRAWRLAGEPEDLVTLRTISPGELEQAADELEGEEGTACV